MVMAFGGGFGWKHMFFMRKQIMTVVMVWYTDCLCSLMLGCTDVGGVVAALVL